VGPFPVFTAPDEPVERLLRVVPTINVDDVFAQAEELRGLGAEVVAAPGATPNGHRLITRHPDGGVFEYVGP
jgi:hypothetical protein